MGRRCVIEGCQSGLNPDRKQRKQLGIRQVSIFQIPKCQDLRKKWSKALVTRLELGNYVCECHFNDLDIKKQDETILPDGTIVAIPLHHHLLNRNAIPSLRPVKRENAEIDETNSRMQIQENLPAVELNAHSTERDTRTRSPSMQLGRFEELLEDTDTEDDSDNNEVQENCPRSQNLESLERPASESDEFNIDHLAQCLEVTPLPKGWAWVTDMNTVTLVRLDIRTCKTILHMKVHADMSITAHAPDGGQMLELHETMKNMLDLLAIIRVIGEKKLCVGTGVEQESRARQCIVSLEPEEYANNVRELRCTHCRQLRRQLQNRNNRSKVDYTAKYAQARHELDCERRKHRRSQKQAIQNFDRYLRNWERAAKEHNQVFPISSRTVSGLKVTLGSPLELIQFLHSDHNFDYLMTVRLNQDALERFFGMMRNACGSNDHPDPTLFAQVFQLLASYSLVKPPEGGNV